MQHSQDFFDEIAQVYDEKSADFLESLEYFRRVTSRYINGKVIDVGNGGVVSFDIEKAKSVVLADVSAAMFDHLKRVKNGVFIPLSRESVACVQTDARSMPFKSEKFDTALLLTTAHHLSEKDVPTSQKNILQAFAEINRILKPGGVFLLLECQLWGPFKFLQDLFFAPAFSFLMRYNKPLPYFMSKAQIAQFLRRNGFKLEKIIYVPSGKKIYLPLFPFITCPGWVWDNLSRSHVFVARKIR